MEYHDLMRVICKVGNLITFSKQQNQCFAIKEGFGSYPFGAIKEVINLKAAKGPFNFPLQVVNLKRHTTETELRL